MEIEFWYWPTGVLWASVKRPIRFFALSREDAEKIGRERFGLGQIVPRPTESDQFPGLDPAEEPIIS